MAALYVGFFMKNPERVFLSGPLVEALKEARIDGQRRTDLNVIFDSFVPNTLTLEERVPLLKAEGFGCSIGVWRPNQDDRYLTCERPLEGTKFCEGFLYFVYETTDRRINLRNGTDYFVNESDRDEDGRCRFNEERYLTHNT